MGRYFNDDLTDDMNDDYNAYLEHYGVPKEKWSAEARSKFDSLHHKTKDTYRSISDGAKKFGSKASKQINGAGQKVKDYFTKSKKRPSNKSSQNSSNTFSFDEKSGTIKAPKGYKKVSSNSQSTTRKAIHQHQQSVDGSPYKSADGFVSKEWAEEQARKAGYSTTGKRHVSSDYERELEYNSKKNVYPKKMKRSK